jgi:putative PIN family toxin of toxin-antitoxin system
VALNVTADSNIYISALVFGGRPLQFLNAARSSVLRLAISDPLWDEVHRVLRDKFQWTPDDMARGGIELGAFTTRVFPTETIAAVVDDPDDNRVLECAVAARSNYIVTGDTDLLRLGRYREIPIMRVPSS